MIEQKPPNIKKSADYKDAYADSVQINFNVWSFSVFLGLVDYVEGVTNIENFARIRLSPETTKALAAILLSQVAAYEKAFGEIPKPAEINTSGTIN